jgi:DNA polymerase-3 subunit delta'
MYDPLDEIIGQDNIKDILRGIISSNRIPHALIFVGQGGVGKEFTAIQFAKALAIQSNSEKKDQILNSIKKLSEPFIKFICALPRGKNETENDNPYEKLKLDDISLIQKEFEKKSENPYYEIEIPNANNIKINSIRDINRFISFSIEDEIKRIVIISNAHLMKEEAQNALLKNLEEPPRDIIFILTTPYPELLRETILSRCWKITFENLRAVEIKKILVKYFAMSNEEAEKLSEISNGSVKTALLFQKYDIEFLTEKIIKILRYSFGKKYHQALSEMEELVSDKVLFKTIISLILIWLSFYNKHRYTKTSIPINQFDETIKKFSQKYPNVNLVDIIQVLDEYNRNLDRNVNPNIISSNLIVKLSSLI